MEESQAKHDGASLEACRANWIAMDSPPFGCEQFDVIAMRHVGDGDTKLFTLGLLTAGPGKGRTYAILEADVPWDGPVWFRKRGNVSKLSAGDDSVRDLANAVYERMCEGGPDLSQLVS